MTWDRWLVLIAGLLLVTFIIWFFWLKRSKGVRAAVTSGGYQEAMILVKGGYTPDTIIISRGKPVRLNFRREETAACSDRVVFEHFGKSAELPTGEVVPVELTPKEAGSKTKKLLCPPLLQRRKKPTRCNRTCLVFEFIIAESLPGLAALPLRKLV